MGMLYGRYDLRDKLTAYKVTRPARVTSKAWRVCSGRWRNPVLRYAQDKLNGACGTGTTRPVVYNTVAEIRRFGEELMKIQAVKIN